MKNRSSGRLRVQILVLLIAAAVVLFLASPVFSDQNIKVSYVRGTVFMGPSQEGPWKTLIAGMPVAEGQFIKTGKGSLIELTMPVDSVMRLSSNTTFKIDRALFSESETPKVLTRLFVGRLWAKINRSKSKGRGVFNTRITTAVLGVRGTVFNVNMAADKSADIHVYEGAVGVGPPLFKKGGDKEELSWPVEVTEKQWEEIIVRQLHRLHIGADGIPGQPEAFDPEKERDAWTLWNRERDSMKK